MCSSDLEGRVVGRAPIDIGCEVEVDEAVGVEVARGGAGKPAVGRDPEFSGGDRSKLAIPLVVIEQATVKAGDEQVGKPVPVPVEDADAVAVERGCGDLGLGGLIAELPVAVVSQQGGGLANRESGRPKCAAAQTEDVGIGRASCRERV